MQSYLFSIFNNFSYNCSFCRIQLSNLLKALFHLKRTKMFSAFIRKLQGFLESTSWSVFITSVILINSACLGLETIKFIHKHFGEILSIIDYICLGIFVVELGLRILAFRLKFFIGKDWGWNWFDFIIVAVSLFAVGGLAVLRAFRVIRIFRLLSVIPTMRLVSAAMLHTIPSMISIMVLLIIFYYIYGVLCVNLFGEAFPQWFGDLGDSFYTLFQIMTLESWSMGIVRPIMEVYPWAWAVFVSFICIVSFIVLNLIVGVVVESIAEMKQMREENTKDSKSSTESTSKDS